MYGLIGKKLGHSFSANFFNKKFKDEGICEEYKLFPIDSISCLPDILKNYDGLKGLNVTIPYKEEVIPFLNEMSPEAREIGAVNTILISRMGQYIFLKGFNTDALGFKNSILPLIRPEMKHSLVLGTGGASKAVDYVLGSLGINVTKVSRTGHADNIITYNDITEEIIANNLLIINTTPLGMYPETETCPPLPYNYLTKRHLCYDLVYNPEMTLFLQKSKEMGAEVKNGLEMLKLQALAAWEIWNAST